MRFNQLVHSSQKFGTTNRQQNGADSYDYSVACTTNYKHYAEQWFIITVIHTSLRTKYLIRLINRLRNPALWMEICGHLVTYHIHWLSLYISMLLCYLKKNVINVIIIFTILFYNLSPNLQWRYNSIPQKRGGWRIPMYSKPRKKRNSALV